MVFSLKFHRFQQTKRNALELFFFAYWSLQDEPRFQGFPDLMPMIFVYLSVVKIGGDQPK